MLSPGVLMYLQWAGLVLIRILEFNADGNISGLNKGDKSWGKKCIIMLNRQNKESMLSFYEADLWIIILVRNHCLHPWHA